MKKDATTIQINVYKNALALAAKGVLNWRWPCPDADIERFARMRFRVRHPRVSIWLGPFHRFYTRMMAGLYYSGVQLVLKRAKADLIVVWNGLSLPTAAALAAARSLGMHTLVMENGLLPNTITADPKGVNFANSLVGKTADFYRAYTPSPEQKQVLAGLTLIGRAPRKRPARSSMTLERELEAIGSGFIFFPFQVHDDSQILLYSPRYRSMLEALKAIVDANEKCLRIVVKEHPSDLGRINYHGKLAGLPNVLAVQNVPTAELLRRSRIVVTINSTVGIEALLLGKPVVTLGNAFYNVPGLVFPAVDRPLSEVLREALECKVDEDLVQRFIAYLYFCYLVPGDWRHPTPENVQNMVKRILSITMKS